MSIMDVLGKGVAALETAGAKYCEVTMVAERAIMRTCGSKKTMDEAMGDGLAVVKRKGISVGSTIKEKTAPPLATCVAKLKVVPLPKIPIPRMPVKKQKDIWTQLATDKKLAAALKFVYQNPCIPVEIEVLPDAPPDFITAVPVIECQGFPLGTPVANDNQALTVGHAQTQHEVSSIPGARKLKNFVRLAMQGQAPCVFTPAKD